MRIKRLEVQGFKSFCDRSVLTFNEPITGVVGPNGCGKSNIVDAIRWCMGEQSAKHLRGKSMDDVIFAGSDSRGPLGMCEVTLVFENDGRVPIEYLAYSEIAVTRKLYRDGTSEYYLNKTPCRLRDITEFFLGTGIGAKAYSIIEQGRVGMIVTSKPEDRRSLIEEAAGITQVQDEEEGRREEDGLDAAEPAARVATSSPRSRSSSARCGGRRRRPSATSSTRPSCATSSCGRRRSAGSASSPRSASRPRRRRPSEEAREAAHGQLVGARGRHRDGAAGAGDARPRRCRELQQGLYELDNRIKLGEAEADHEEREAAALEERALRGARRDRAARWRRPTPTRPRSSGCATSWRRRRGGERVRARRCAQREEALRVVKEAAGGAAARASRRRAPRSRRCKGEIVAHRGHRARGFAAARRSAHARPAPRRGRGAPRGAARRARARRRQERARARRARSSSSSTWPTRSSAPRRASASSRRCCRAAARRSRR